jgi:hypothetical protein
MSIRKLGVCDASVETICGGRVISATSFIFPCECLVCTVIFTALLKALSVGYKSSSLETAPAEKSSDPFNGIKGFL